MKPNRIMFVCMGNICRSPTAEGVFRKIAAERTELFNLEIESSGTTGYHVGEPPDARSVSTASKRGYDLTSIRSRKLSKEDLRRYDHILVMDNENLKNVIQLAEDNNIGIEHIKLFLEFAENEPTKEVSDPYYGGPSGFDDVIDLIESASHGFIKQLLESQA